MLPGACSTKKFTTFRVLSQRLSMRNSSHGHKAPWYYLLLLILAGESVFILPFVLARVFRPTVLEAFRLDNVGLGLCFSVYGVVALVSYLLGGPLADRFPPRKLMATALWATALGGWLYARFPGLPVLEALYGYWGFTTIFLFWAPMIKAARVWGGDASQGKAYGFLDGGRGLVGALFGALSVFIFSLYAGSSDLGGSLGETREAFRQVILTCSALVAGVGVLVWFFLRMEPGKDRKSGPASIRAAELKAVLRLRSVWLLMLMILCAYTGYKITDVFSLYAQDVMGYDPVASARVGTFLLFVRPAAGVAIGILADRTDAAWWLWVSFVVMLLGSLLFATGILPPSSTLLFFLSIFIVASGVYAARSLYFAVMKQGRIPLALTGTAVGLVSVVGFTPDIFAGPAMGYLLDQAPGPPGHRQVFWMLGLFALVGGVAARAYYRQYRLGGPKEKKH